MGSTLSVSHLRGLTSGSDANKIIVDSGHTISAEGMVVQIKQKLVTTMISLTGNSSATPTQISDFDISITPKLANSKIKITLNVSFIGTNSTPMLHLFHKVGSNSYAEVDVNTDTSIGSRRRGFTTTGFNFSDGNQQRSHCATYIHEPTYSVGGVLHYRIGHTSDNTQAWKINASNTDSNSVTGTRSFSSLTLEEIAQ